MFGRPFHYTPGLNPSPPVSPHVDTLGRLMSPFPSPPEPSYHPEEEIYRPARTPELPSPDPSFAPTSPQPLSPPVSSTILSPPCELTPEIQVIEQEDFIEPVQKKGKSKKQKGKRRMVFISNTGSTSSDPTPQPKPQSPPLISISNANRFVNMQDPNAPLPIPERAWSTPAPPTTSFTRTRDGTPIYHTAMPT